MFLRRSSIYQRNPESSEGISYVYRQSLMKSSAIEPRPTSEKPGHNSLSYSTVFLFLYELIDILFVCFTSNVESIFSSALLSRHMQHISGGM
jgi:hypothetical protein